MTKAEKEAEDLVFDMGLTLPIVPEEVCELISLPDFKVSYVEEPMETNDFLGMSRATDDGAVIIVNQGISPPGRKLFTAAHEVGHVLMHIQVGQENHFECSQADIFGKAKVNYEKEANEFASSLTMPKSLIGEMINQNDISWQLMHLIKSECETTLIATARRVINLTGEVCALIVHKDGEMWNPYKSKTFDYFVPKHPFSKSLKTAHDLPTESFTDEFLECEPLDWGISDKGLPDSILYSSIHNDEFNRTMTLLLIPEIEEDDEVSCEPTF